MMFIVPWSCESAAAERDDCFSCEIKVKSLRKPLELRGKWLFTRDDKPENKNPETDTSNWVTVATPGPWSKAYRDGEYFDVGWYRGNFTFANKLIGKKAVFYVDAYMSRLQIFQDGELVLRRDGQHSHERFYSIQPIPVVIDITKPNHVITMRIDTHIMIGVYQLPFQLRPYKDFDPTITFYQMFGGEVRNIAAYVLFTFGLFFLLVYSRTHYKLYMVAGLTGIGIFPFYAFPHDNLVKLFPLEKLWILHYVGISCMALGHVTYSQYFHKITPRINKMNYIVVALLGGMFVAMTFRFNMHIFQIIRKLTFLYSLWMAMHLVWNCYFAVRANSRLLVLFLGEFFFWACSVHDILLALGIIQSTSLIFIGTLVATSSILYLTAVIFAETFMQNKHLLAHVEQVNQNLEQTVAIRTQDLYEKKQNLSLILQSLPEGILTIDPSLRILPEYSLALETILETQHIEGRDIFQLLFAHSTVALDMQSQMRSILEFSFGESDLNFDTNRELFVKEFQTNMRGRVKTLALGWSPVLTADGTVAKILLTVSDVTQVKALEQESQMARLRSKIVEAIMGGSIQRIHDFVETAQKALQPFVSSLKESQLSEIQIASLYREVHTIKGNARTFDLLDLAETAHHVETDLTELKRRSEHMDSEQIQFILQNLIAALQHFEDIKDDVMNRLQWQGSKDLQQVDPKLWNMFKARWQHLSDEHLAERISSLQQDIQVLSYRQVQPYFQGLVHAFDDVAQGLGKPAPEIHLEISEELYVDPALLKSINDVLVHLIRNSLDHGIELASSRQALHKPERGQIRIGFRRQTKGFVIDYADDGGGLNLEKIRQRALQLGFAEAQSSSPEQWVQTIFMHGMSTAEKVSDVSGRGVGMEVVAQELRQWKARLRWNQMAQLGPDAKMLAFDISVLFPTGSSYISQTSQEVRMAL